MPDLDIIRKGVHPHFRRSFRLIVGGQANEAVEASCRAGLAGSLRRGGGIPHLRERAELLVGVGSGGSVTAALDGSRALMDLENRNRNSNIVDRAFRRMIQDGMVPTNRAEAEYQLAVYAQRELLDHGLLSRVRFEAEEMEVTRDQMDELLGGINGAMEPAYEFYARQLVEDPTAAEIRTMPSPPRTRPPTEVLLEQEI